MQNQTKIATPKHIEDFQLSRSLLTAASIGFDKNDLRKERISAPLRSTHELEKPSGSLRLFRTSTAHVTIRYTTTSITFKHVVEKLEQSWATVNTVYCQNRDQKKTPIGKKTIRQDIWVGSWLMIWKAHPTKATRLEGLCPYLLNM